MRGRLLVHDRRISELNRTARVAEFVLDSGDPLRLVDVNLLCATAEILVLTGFEQLYVDTRLTDYAQTWVLTECEGDSPQGTFGPPYPR